MSRRCHHGSPRHVRNGRERTRPAIPERPIRAERGPSVERLTGIDAAAQPRLESLSVADDLEPAAAALDLDPTTPSDRSATPLEPAAIEPAAVEPAAVEPWRAEPEAAEPAAMTLDQPAPPIAARRPVSPAPGRTAPRVEPARPNGSDGHAAQEADESAMDRGATAPQLRRFIKSRAYVPMHELRRRFAINGGDDEVTQVELERQRVYVGLPEREGRLLGELLRGGDIGYELSLDPISPIVVGVYPMRPVTRA
jgi:hypothetical protein